jgi:hypothetical protein
MQLNFTCLAIKTNGVGQFFSRTRLAALLAVCAIAMTAQVASAQCLPRDRSTLTLTSGVASLAQLVSLNTPIAPITFNSARATGARFSGLPDGVTGTWAANVVTISGTPTEAGIFTWSVTLTGGCELIPTLRAGVITVAPVAILSATTTDICGDGSTTITIENPELLGFAQWQWYSGSCGGTKVGTGNSITVTPTATTQYFVRREGGLISLPDCGSITINKLAPQYWYLDADDDGYYTGEPMWVCASPGKGYKTKVAGGNDCDDSNPRVNPGAREVCGNSIDDNCNGIVDENCCTGIKISVPRAVIVWETPGGITYGEIVVALNKPCSSPVSTDWAFANGTFVNPVNNATLGSDFNAGGGRLTFAPGETQKTIVLEVLSDGLVEDFEYVNVVFSNPVNATTENGRALIGSNDTYPCRAEASPTFTEGNPTVVNQVQAQSTARGSIMVNNNRRTIEYVMKLNKPYPAAVSVAYRTADNTAKAGQDYVSKSGVVTFMPNQTSAIIELEIITDLVPEQKEGFFLILTLPRNLGCNGPESYAAIFIMDDDMAMINKQTLMASAKGASATTATVTSSLWPNPVRSQLNVSLSAPASERVTLQLVNAQGNIVKQKNTLIQSKLGNVSTFQVGDLPSGNYKLLVTGQSFRETKSVLIQR